MASLQNPKGNSKSAKFHAANPLGPMADPFAGLDDDQQEFQKALSENINDRMGKAMDDLKEKHRQGTNERDDADKAPTGDAYRAIERNSALIERNRHAQLEHSRQKEAETLARVKGEVQRHFQTHKQDEDATDSDEDNYDDLLDDDDDPTLEAIRYKRMQELRMFQETRADNLAKGHGECRTIQQDDFLPECAGGSEWVAVHFFHQGFERCKVLDHHLKVIAPKHISCKFLRMDAEKAPFFVGKLNIQTLPALLVFQDGKIVDRLTGFEGLALDPAEPDKWHTGRLEEWLSSTGAIKYTVPTEELKAEMERLGLTAKKSIWRGGIRRYNEDE